MSIGVLVFAKETRGSNGRRNGISKVSRMSSKKKRNTTISMFAKENL